MGCIENREAFDAAVRAARKPRSLEAGGITRLVHDITAIPGSGNLPRVLVVFLENCVRRAATDDEAVTLAARIVEAGLQGRQGDEIEFMPARVLFQDFTGVPVFVDFAAMRDAMVERGGDPSLVNPRIPCTLIVDHSVIADEAGCEGCAKTNEANEVRRNRERFAFLKWASRSFQNVQIVPPGGGICHQLNIERFCSVVMTDALAQEGEVACFDTLVGTDSHTPTANGLGVVGWGVGGIEAEAAALGQPISMLVPPVVELRLTGRLSDGVSGMDLALTVAKTLRAEGVVGALVEVTGEGAGTLSATQRACVANMTPEYGATTTLFPVDDTTLSYLSLTGRDEAEIAFARAYLEAEGVYGTEGDRVYARTITLDLSKVETCLAGPSRPHNYVLPAQLAERFRGVAEEHGHGDAGFTVPVTIGDQTFELGHGTLAIAAITSCTTATDPAMMVAAGLLAKEAVDRGLATKPWIKRIFAPGSRATELILERAGLTDALFKLGFYTCGYGCMSCIGNSGEIAAALKPHASELELTSVLSGNRNFDGRISPDVAQNFLCQPALVVAYALVGTMDADLATQPVGTGADGAPVMLADLMPTNAEIEEVLGKVLTRDVFAKGAKSLMDGSDAWQAIPTRDGDTFDWDASSTYIQRAPYFDLAEHHDVVSLSDARALALLGDFVTTDHISPAGSIAVDSPAGSYLAERGIKRDDFNTYGARRGNHEVMMRGTFANVKLTNLMADGRVGGWTKNVLTGQIVPIYDAVFDTDAGYAAAKIPLVIVAGKLYGSGSSRDWAAKGPALLHVKCVIAESFERIHRSNLVQMGVVPLQLEEGATAASLGLDGSESYTFDDIDVSGGLPASPTCTVRARRADGTQITFACKVRVDTPMEGAFLASGGILPYVLDQLAGE